MIWQKRNGAVESRFEGQFPRSKWFESKKPDDLQGCVQTGLSIVPRSIVSPVIAGSLLFSFSMGALAQSHSEDRSVNRRRKSGTRKTEQKSQKVGARRIPVSQDRGLHIRPRNRIARASTAPSGRLSSQRAEGRQSANRESRLPPCGGVESTAG